MRRVLMYGVAAAVFIGSGVLCLAWYYRSTYSIEVVKPTEAILAPTAPAELDDSDWNCWRGRKGDACAASGHPPVKWSTEENVTWSAPLPGGGHSSPIVVGDRVFVTTALDAESSQRLLSFDKGTGALVWERELHHGKLPVKHDRNSHASATPASDGRLIYTVFAVDDAIWVSGVDLDGQVLWQREAGSFVSQHGYGSSPALYGPLVIVAADNRGSKLGRLRVSSFLAALDGATGEIRWRIQRPEEHSFGTPIVVDIDGRQQLLLSGCSQVTAYEPLSGDVLWTSVSAASRTANTVAFGGGMVFSSAAYPDKELIAIQADGVGDVSTTKIVWKDNRLSGDVPSPLFVDGLLYVAGDQGVMTCFDVTDGDVVWKKRLPGNFSSSPAFSDGRIYVSNQAGTTYILSSGRDSEIISTNELADPIYASPAFSGEQLFLRSPSRLYCISDSMTPASQATEGHNVE